jgi:hypothetical protein
MAGDGGWVLVGPGSEWFWSIVGNAVLVVTLVGLYLQLRAERASRVFEQVNTLEAQWNERHFKIRRLQALLDLEGRPVEAGMPEQATIVTAWFDRLGLLVRKGHVPQVDVADSFAESVLAWSSLVGPYLAHDRERFNAPAHLRDFDDLVARMRRSWELDFGRPYEPYGTLEDRIDALSHALRFEQDVDAGRIPERVTAPAAAQP